MRFLVALFLLSIPFAPLCAQRRDQPLGGNAADFEAGLGAYMLADPNLTKDEKELLQTWTAGYLDYFSSLRAERREEVAEMARMAHKARVKAYPELYAFLRTQQLMQQRHNSVQNEWLEILRQKLKKTRTRHFNTLVDRTYKLLEEGEFYKSNAAWWQGPEIAFTVLEINSEPVFRFEEIDLKCRAYHDSTCIYGTRGDYYPLADRFEGKGGRVYWERVGLATDSCYTDLKNYSLNFKQGRFQASDVIHRNLYLYPKDLHGDFSERLTAGDKLKDSHYPQFVARERLFVRDIFTGVDVRGPLVQEGNREYFGSASATAQVDVREEDDAIRVRLSSSRFQFERGKLSSSDARLVMRLHEDSLYNPSVNVRYDADNRVLHVTSRQGDGLSAPFIDTYHKVRMEFEALRWYLDRNEVEIGLLQIPGRVGSVSFKSLNLFSREELGKITLGMEANPFFILASLSKRVNSRELYLDEVAEVLNVSSTQALAMLYNFIAYGYVSYDPVRKTVTLLPQLFHTLEVTANRADFDEIEFKTTEDGIVKAVLRLDSLDIRMAKVPYILLSGKQDVYALPVDSVIHIYKDADFYFNGLFHAGNFNYTVRGARFYYNDFKVDIADVQEMGLEVRRMEDGEIKRHPVESVIKSLAGTVLIDDPGNKGGRKDFPEYPIFESTQPSYVYYDDARVQKGAYTADSFYFRVDPFRMEKLSSVNVDSIRFAGTLLSFGLFPDIREELVIRPDYSLGFATVSPEGGWPVYDGKTRYSGELFLDNSGLYGHGDFAYLGANAASRRMVFLPRRMYARVEEFTFPDTVPGNYPLVRANKVEGDFVRRSGLFSLRSVKDSLLHFYAEDWKLSGTYTFSPGVSRAQGTLSNRSRFFVDSRSFSLARRVFRADTGDFRIASGESNLLATREHTLTVDLDKGQGKFRSADGTSPLAFGVNRYETSVSEMDWSMERKQVRMKHGEEASSSWRAALDSMSKGELFTAILPGEKFVSTRRAQAGLNFYGTSSLFSYADTVLRVDGVERVLVADALFVPASGRVVIGKTGQMEPLYGAELYFGDRNRLHSFHDVQAQVYSSEQYRASGLFDYRAPHIEQQAVSFAGIRPMGDGFSQASARITFDSGVLALNEAFEFIGKIELSAQETYPLFAGSVRMKYTCQVSENNPSEAEETDFYDTSEEDFEYRSEDEEEFEDSTDEKASGKSGYDDFEFEEEDTRRTKKREEEFEDEDSKRLNARGKKKTEDAPVLAEEVIGLAADNPFLADGIQFEAYINSDSVQIPFDEKTRSTVGRLLGCGFYTQDRSNQPQFLFMQRKISTDHPNLAVTGNLEFSRPDKAYRVMDSLGEEVFALRLNSCFALATGDIDLTMNTYELGMRLYGNMMRDGNTGTISTRALSIFDFYLTDEVARRLAAHLNKFAYSSYNGSSGETYVSGFLQHHVPEKERQRMEAELRLTGVLSKIPDILKQSLVFSDLELEWDAGRKAFFSSGETAELMAIGGNAVNKKLKVMAALRKTRRGDVVDIYLEANANAWIYFSYTNHYMQIVTSDDALNEYIATLKPGTRKKGRYEFNQATVSKRNSFLGSFQNR
ncbi:hypothetical protein HDR62_06460 [bacterium]|nr:hypothetical protein [bacterium]